MAKVEFTEVKSDSFIGNQIGAQEADTTISNEDLGLSDDAGDESAGHVYIAFTDGVSIDQGISIIENTIINGHSLQITRRDDNHNGVVAIVTGSEAKSIEKLAEVSFIKIDKGAEKTTDSTGQTTESTQQTQITESETNDEVEETEETKTEETKTEETEIEETETISEVQENNVDTNVKTVSPTPIVVALILGLAILIGIILHKANR